MTTATGCSAVTAGCSTGNCGRLSKPSWLLVHTIIQSNLGYLLSYLKQVGVLTLSGLFASMILFTQTSVFRNNTKQ